MNLKQEVKLKDPELPLLARPAWIEGSKLEVLDETALPDEIRFIYASDYREAGEIIRQMKTRAFGQVYVVLEAMRLTAIRNRDLAPDELVTLLDKARRVLGKARPTLNLKRVADAVYDWALEAKEKRSNIAEAINKKVEQQIKRIKDHRLKWAKVASSLVGDSDTILTHCNMSGMIVLLGRECRKQGKNVKFIVTETRPYMQGVRETAWELAIEGFDITLIVDSAAGYVIWKGMVDLVIVGADRCAMNGDIANKIGTYQIALAAFENNVPFYVAARPDISIGTGQEIPIEERKDDEMLYWKGRRIAPEGVKGYCPIFDITPAKYISGIIRHTGIFPPRAISKLVKGKVFPIK